MEFFIILIEFVLKLFFTFMSIEIFNGVSFALFLASAIAVYLFIRAIIESGGGRND